MQGWLQMAGARTHLQQVVNRAGLVVGLQDTQVPRLLAFEAPECRRDAVHGAVFQG